MCLGVVRDPIGTVKVKWRMGERVLSNQIILCEAG